MKPINFFCFSPRLFIIIFSCDIVHYKQIKLTEFCTTLFLFTLYIECFCCIAQRLYCSGYFAMNQNAYLKGVKWGTHLCYSHL